jgi:predicted deacylase
MISKIKADQFKFESISEAGKHKVFLDVGENTGIPLMIANGMRSGKTLVAFAAVHGDELEGVQAIQDVFAELDTDEMTGRFIAVPVANVPAFHAVDRLSPVDSLNLARTFPGKKDGSVTERLAYYLGELIIPEADFFLDLHSASASLMPTMVGYDAADTAAGRISKDAALMMGMPVIWGHPDVGPGRTLCAAMERGIPWLYVESPSGRRVSPEGLPYYINVLLNLLGYLRIIGRSPSKTLPELHLLGEGDVDRTQKVTTSGFFVHKAKLLEHVESGQIIAEVRDIFGDVLEEIQAEHAGYIAVLRSEPLVSAGDPVCLVVDGSPVRG